MSDYITRTRLCEQIESHKEEYFKLSMIYGFGFNEGANFIRKCISEVPSADVVERKKGEWIDKGWHGDWQFETDGKGNCWKVFECSNCNCPARHITPFCPQCGAKMKGVEK